MTDVSYNKCCDTILYYDRQVEALIRIVSNQVSSL